MIWVLILFYLFLKLVIWVFLKMGFNFFYILVVVILVVILLFYIIFNICNMFLLMWFIKFIVKFVEWLVLEKEVNGKEMDEFKFLSNRILVYLEILIFFLWKELKFFFKNVIFDIVLNVMNIIIIDIKFDIKIKKIVKRNKEDFKINVDDLYYIKVKNIYGKIIEFVIKG